MRVEALANENARLQKAVAARDAFLAIAAHELRNPMTPILGRVTLLRRILSRGELPKADVLERLDGIEKLVLQFIERATTLLDLSRADADRPVPASTPVDAVAIARGVVDTYRPAALHAGATLSFEDAAPGGAVVLADPLALVQILENLIANAVKYGAGSPITVTVTASATPGRARIRVRDEGPGIAREHQARIFERFERAVRPGSAITGYGVGLWIVRCLCDAMDATVVVDSATGAGCTFDVSLPLHVPKDPS